MSKFDKDNLNIPNLQILKEDNKSLFADAKDTKNDKDLNPSLASHPGFSRIFQKGKLTIGLMAPFKGFPAEVIPDVSDMVDLAKMAEDLGFAALWLRDVPFYDPQFGDPGQNTDPSFTLGLLANATSKIALGTAGLIVPQRHPVHIASLAESAEQFTNGRFILGLASGDRESEYNAFNLNWEERGDIFRDGWDVIKNIIDSPSPEPFKSKYFGELNPRLSYLPPHEESVKIPMVAIGRARQSISWLANSADAWIWHGVGENGTRKVVDKIDNLNEDGFWHPLGYQYFVELLEDPDTPCDFYNGVYLRGGARSIARFLEKQRQQGLSHVILNLKPSSYSAVSCLHDLHDFVLSQF